MCWVDFINILHTLLCAQIPKEQKDTEDMTKFLHRSAHVKAGHKHVGEIDP